jgi:hypothetical protein
MREMNLKSYLLGTLSEPERTVIDRGILTNEDDFEQVLLAEDDLIEDYLQDNLSAIERLHFEQCFLADPERQQKLQLARALHRYANDHAKNSSGSITAAAVSTAADSWWAVWRRPVWQWATACGLLVVALFGIRAVFQPTVPDQIVHSSPSPTITVAPMGTEIVPAELFPGQVRAIGTTSPRVKLSPNSRTVQLTLRLRKRAYPSYQVTLLDEEAEQKSLGAFNPQTASDGDYLTVPIPITALGTGDYRVRLEGITPNGTERAETYYFTVDR